MSPEPPTAISDFIFITIVTLRAYKNEQTTTKYEQMRQIVDSVARLRIFASSIFIIRPNFAPKVKIHRGENSYSFKSN